MNREVTKGLHYIKDGIIWTQTYTAHNWLFLNVSGDSYDFILGTYVAILGKKV